MDKRPPEEVYLEELCCLYRAERFRGNNILAIFEKMDQRAKICFKCLLCMSTMIYTV
ncbi:2209_t:CDS:2 [Acaulospora morrowiae]|uniref:2209_t:CDS:1 n=1 Tax=Acaulospora morrowiae TaxID=94023 RepID=A0A9N8YZW4_9GLOM|nr:2209_t:CDS:2 [Acaulospora morrowiae]